MNSKASSSATEIFRNGLCHRLENVKRICSYEWANERLGGKQTRDGKMQSRLVQSIEHDKMQLFK